MQPRARSTIAKPDMTIREVMQVIQDQPRAIPPGPAGIALITDTHDKLLGIVTDGDIRRALLSGASLEASITDIMNRRPRTFDYRLSPNDLLAKVFEAIREMNKPGARLDIIVTVDEKNRVVDVFRFFDLWKETDIKIREFSVVGLGYVGLTLSLVLAEAGYHVYAVDSDPHVIRELNQKKTRVYEKEIIPLLKKHLGKRFFAAKTFTHPSDVYIICVGTPLNHKGRVTLGAVTNALNNIVPFLKNGDLVILRSTVAVGTCQKVVAPFLERHTGLKVGKDIYLAFAPERAIEGNAINELRTLPQIIGGFDQKSTELAAQVFQHITNSIIRVESLEAAEIIKLINNTYRDLSFAFANEIAKLCSVLNLNSANIINTANQGYPRSAVPLPSPGVGGACLTKDPYILAQSASPLHTPLLLPKAGRKVNESMIAHVVSTVEQFLKKHHKGKRAKIFVVGLAFKGEPETADMRDSTSVTIARVLQQKFPRLSVYDPVVPKNEITPKGFRFQNIHTGFTNASAVLILNNHHSYQTWDIHSLLETMNKPGLFYDAWHLFDTVLTKPPVGITHRGV